MSIYGDGKIKKKINFAKKTFLFMMVLFALSSANVYAKTSYYKHIPTYSGDEEDDLYVKAITNLSIDLNRDGRKEKIVIQQKKSGLYSNVEIFINSQKKLKLSTVEELYFVDWNNKDKYVELFIRTPKEDKMYRYKNKKLALYAKGKITTSTKNPYSSYFHIPCYREYFVGNGTAYSFIQINPNTLPGAFAQIKVKVCVKKGKLLCDFSKIISGKDIRGSSKIKTGSQNLYSSPSYNSTVCGTLDSNRDPFGIAKIKIGKNTTWVYAQQPRVFEDFYFPGTPYYYEGWFPISTKSKRYSEDNPWSNTF